MAVKSLSVSAGTNSEDGSVRDVFVVLPEGCALEGGGGGGMEEEEEEGPVGGGPPRLRSARGPVGTFW